MNLERMQTLRDYIAELPDQETNMSTWMNVTGENLYVFHVDQLIRAQQTYSCGTSFCIAGHAVVLGISRGEISPGSTDTIPEVASTWLGLQANTYPLLFHIRRWEAEDRDEYCKGNRKQAVLSAIDKFIEGMKP